MAKHDASTDLEIDNLPNRLTLFRMALIPVVVGLLYAADMNLKSEWQSNFGWAAAWIFALASITDFFDGYIARKKNIVTVFGSFLDPIADKFLTVSSLIMLQALGRVPAFIVIILVLREMYMTSLRLLANNEGINVPVNAMGKWKTAIMMIGIPMMMANENWWVVPFPLLGMILIYAASILSLWSAVVYSINMIQKLKQSRAEKRKASEDKT
ncbi:MAG: CDP-diacylglycerol--glycerol-3-phosphate 3-phosphatidyltransferase [Bacteriovoracaceae bacterium]